MIKTFKKSFIKNASHTDIPRLLEPLKRGEADLVLGSRFKGEIKKGAMPWHHQYIGNPVLTWIFNLNKANKSNISDTHSGFRAFTKEAYEKMRTDLKATGMEFASVRIPGFTFCIGDAVGVSFFLSMIGGEQVKWTS